MPVSPARRLAVIPCGHTAACQPGRRHGVCRHLRGLCLGARGNRRWRGCERHFLFGAQSIHEPAGRQLDVVVGE